MSGLRKERNQRRHANQNNGPNAEADHNAVVAARVTHWHDVALWLHISDDGAARVSRLHNAVIVVA